MSQSVLLSDANINILPDIHSQNNKRNHSYLNYISNLIPSPGSKILKTFQGFTQIVFGTLYHKIEGLEIQNNRLTVATLALYGLIKSSNAQENSINNLSLTTTQLPIISSQDSSGKNDDREIILLFISLAAFMISFGIYLCKSNMLFCSSNKNNEKNLDDKKEHVKNNKEISPFIFNSKYIPSIESIIEKKYQDIESQSNLKINYKDKLVLNRLEQKTFGVLYKLIGNDPEFIKSYEPSLLAHLVFSKNLEKIIKSNEKPSINTLLKSFYDNIQLAQNHLSLRIFMLTSLQTVINYLLEITSDKILPKEVKITIALISTGLNVILQSPYKANLLTNNFELQFLFKKIDHLKKLSDEIDKMSIKETATAIALQIASVLVSPVESLQGIFSLLYNTLKLAKAIDPKIFLDILAQPVSMGAMSLIVFPLASYLSGHSSKILLNNFKPMANEKLKINPNQKNINKCENSIKQFGPSVQQKIMQIGNYFLCKNLDKFTISNPSFKNDYVFNLKNTSKNINKIQSTSNEDISINEISFRSQTIEIDLRTDDKSIIPNSDKVLYIDNPLEICSYVNEIKKNSNENTSQILSKLIFIDKSKTDLIQTSKLEHIDFGSYLDFLNLITSN